jgi:hypothetical protein
MKSISAYTKGNDADPQVDTTAQISDEPHESARVAQSLMSPAQATVPSLYFNRELSAGIQ